MLRNTSKQADCGELLEELRPMCEKIATMADFAHYLTSSNWRKSVLGALARKGVAARMQLLKLEPDISIARFRSD